MNAGFGVLPGLGTSCSGRDQSCIRKANLTVLEHLIHASENTDIYCGYNEGTNILT